MTAWLDSQHQPGDHGRASGVRAPGRHRFARTLTLARRL